MFIAGAYESLRRRMLNMSVLIAVGVLAASVEQGSEHPLATAIVTGARERGLSLADASQFEAFAGHGIRAMVEAKTLLVGNRKLMTDNKVAIDTIEAQAATLAEDGKTPMFVAIDGRAAGLVAVADTIKPTAAESSASSPRCCRLTRRATSKSSRPRASAWRWWATA